MNRILSYLVVGVAAFLAGGAAFFAVGQPRTAANQAESPESIKAVDAVLPRDFVIEGMHCQSCADALHDAIGQIPGVRSVTVSFENKRAVVEAEPSQTPDEKILAAIVKVGYQGKSANAATAESVHSAGSDKAPILVNITRGKNDVHAVSMAIGLAQSALRDGRKAAVFLNVEAPVFAAKDLDDELKCADFPPIKKMLSDFIEQGGKVLICQHCASVVKLPTENVIDKATTTGHGGIFAELAPNTIVFSY